jgi:hypothetical protein
MGFWDDFGDALEEIGEGVWGATKEVAKFTARTGAVVGAGAAIVATGGVAAPLIGGGTYLIGKGLKKMGEDGDDTLESVGGFIKDVGFDGLTGGLFGLGSSVTNSLAAREMARHGGRLTNGAKVFFTANRVIRIGDKFVDIYGKSKEEVEEKIRIYHGQHKGRGISYDSKCPLCNGDFDRLP